MRKEKLLTHVHANIFGENALILEPTERQKGIKTCYLLEIGYSYKPLIIWSLGTKKSQISLRLLLWTR